MLDLSIYPYLFISHLLNNSIMFDCSHMNSITSAIHSCPSLFSNRLSGHNGRLIRLRLLIICCFVGSLLSFGMCAWKYHEFHMATLFSLTFLLIGKELFMETHFLFDLHQNNLRNQYELFFLYSFVSWYYRDVDHRAQLQSQPLTWLPDFSCNKTDFVTITNYLTIESRIHFWDRFQKLVIQFLYKFIPYGLWVKVWNLCIVSLIFIFTEIVC